MAKLAINGGMKANPQKHIHWPVITVEDKEMVMKVMESKILWGSTAPQVTALEKEWAEYVGTQYVLACNSGTAGLHMAVAAAGISPGDEVITPSLTFVATQMVVLQHNAIPVFVDVDPRTFNIDVKKIKEKITNRTKAIIPVDLHGQPADYDEINDIARKHNLIVIADSAQAHGACYKGRKVGTLADISVFSLNGLKNLQAGDGGLLNTDSEVFRAKADQCRVFGEIVSPGHSRNYNSLSIGWMYRMMEWPAAFTRSRLKCLDAENVVRVQNAEYLTKSLSGLSGIIPPYILPDRSSVYNYYRIRLNPASIGLSISPNVFRAKVQKALDAEGIVTARWQTRPVQRQNVFIERIGYGKGCPWSCPFSSGRQIEYGPEDYEETKKILEDSFVFSDALYPPNGLELMERYAEGIKKVWDNLDEVLAVELSDDDPLLLS